MSFQPACPGGGGLPRPRGPGIPRPSRPVMLESLKEIAVVRIDTPWRGLREKAPTFGRGSSLLPTTRQKTS